MGRISFEELDRLETALRDARQAVSAHVRQVASAWYGDEPPEAEPGGTLDHAWLEEYGALQAAEDDARRELDDYIRTSMGSEGL